MYYTSSLICEQLGKGDKDGNYQLKETYLIGMMNFCFNDTLPDKFIHHVQLSETDNGRVFYDRLVYIFIELPKFKKTPGELHNAVDQWIFALRHMHRMEEIPVFLNKPVFLKLFNIAEMSNLSTQERAYYDVSLKRKRDWESSLQYAKKQGAEEGVKKAQHSIARNLKIRGIPLDMIASATGLTIEEVEGL